MGSESEDHKQRTGQGKKLQDQEEELKDEKKQETQPKEESSEGNENKAKTVQEVIHDLTIGAKERALENIDKQLARLEKQKLGPQGMNPKQYEDNRKDLLHQREKRAKQNLEVESVMVIVQLNNRTVPSTYSNNLRVDEKVYPGFTYDEMYGALCQLKFHIERLTIHDLLFHPQEGLLAKVMSGQNYYTDELLGRLNNLLVASKKGIFTGPPIHFP